MEQLIKQGESMNLPKGWDMKKLEELCEILDNKRKPISQKNRVFGEYPYYGATGIVDYVNEYIFNEDLILIGEDGAKWDSMENSAFIVKGKYWVNNHAHVIRPLRAKILDNWIVFFLNYSNLLSYVTGLTVPKLNQEKLRSIGIPLPPLPEQLRIVSILDQTFAALAKAKGNAQRNLQNAKELFERYLQGVFESKIHGSKSETLDELCELVVDCEHKTAPIQETGYPSIRTPNIGKGVLILEDVNRVSHETYLDWTRRAIPKADDLILAREAPAGNIAVIPEKIEVCLGQRTVLIRPKKNKFISKYLAYLILSKGVQEKLLSHSRGATVEHINMKDIREFKIYNLSPISEQNKVVANLDALSAETKRLEAIYQQKLLNLEELKKAVLQKAFNGQLSEL